ncbi:hypothetical protein ACFZAD_24595 [Streptomyces iakyrus]|uniref:hypothetical protein n=1 Tax=Streptomyces iakyrus TaxID=68219 RepID=UPI0036EAE6DF
MASEIRVTIHGASDLAKRLRKFGVSVLDLTDSMDETGAYLTGFFSGEVFASRGGVLGQPWARLKESYAVEKAKQWPGRPPLIRTGLMNRSFKHDAGPMSVEVFNSDPKFHFHQEGTRRIPARVMMDVDQRREAMIGRFIAKDIESKMRSANV